MPPHPPSLACLGIPIHAHINVTPFWKSWLWAWGYMSFQENVRATCAKSFCPCTKACISLSSLLPWHSALNLLACAISPINISLLDFLLSIHLWLWVKPCECITGLVYALRIFGCDVKLNENVTNSNNWAVFASIKFKILLKYWFQCLFHV